MKKQLFREHYSAGLMDIDKIQRRELAFQTWDSPSPDKRYNYFETLEELRDYLRTSNVSGVFSSTGYFMDPNVRDTSKRGHLGQDLVIDIDRHISGSRIEWMEDICETTTRLVNVLAEDFGFAKRDMILEFSGNKGFHILILGKEKMTKESRSAIVNYLTGDTISRVNLEPSKGGWGKTLKESLVLIGKGCTDNAKGNEKFLLALGLSKVQAKKISNHATKPEIRSGLVAGRLNCIGDGKSRKAIVNWSVNSRKETFSTVDKGVTTDKNRILRVGGSIHPKSGLVCTTIDLDDLDEPQKIFDRLKEIGGLDEVRITLTEPAIENFERMHRWEPGTYKVPRWLALHLIVQN
jgi:DNA primase small subunit